MSLESDLQELRTTLAELDGQPIVQRPKWRGFVEYMGILLDHEFLVERSGLIVTGGRQSASSEELLEIADALRIPIVQSRVVHPSVSSDYAILDEHLVATWGTRQVWEPIRDQATRREVLKRLAPTEGAR